MLDITTFAAFLSNKLTAKILDKFTQSKTDLFNRLSAKYRQDIKFLEHNNQKFIHPEADKFEDGSLKPQTNYWDLLDQTDKEEVLSFINLEQVRNQERRAIRLYLLPLANKTKHINDFNQLTSVAEVMYLKFFSCLPDCILSDTTTLIVGNDNLGHLTEQDLYEIKNFAVTPKTQKDIEDFKQANKDEKIEEILKSLYALDFLVNF